MMKTLKRVGLILIGVLFFACSGNPAPAPVSAPVSVVPPDELDTAIRETSDYLNRQLPKGNRLVILNIQSDFPALSEYIIDELIANTVNDRVFSVVDRRQLDTIRAELDFHMSGEVDDETAQALGRMAGAQMIVSGAISKIGNLYRLRVRVLSVQNAQIEGQFNRNIPEGVTIASLIESRATGYGSESTYPGAGGNRTANAPQQAPTPPASTAPVVQTPTTQAQTSPVTATTPTTQTPAVPVTPAPSAPAPVVVPVQAVPPPTPPPPPPQPTTYKIGDRGPAGGIIFYDKGNNSDGWRYLEVASRDAGSVRWGTEDTISGTKVEIGTGKQNTQIIIDYMMETGKNHPAAMVCRQYSQGGYSDWFLPSKAELNLMYWNLKQQGLGNLGSGWYWSSSHGGTYYATWLQSFNDGQ